MAGESRYSSAISGWKLRVGLCWFEMRASVSGMMRDSSDHAMLGVAMAKRDAASTNVTMWLCCMDDGGAIGRIVSLLIAIASAGE